MFEYKCEKKSRMANQHVLREHALRTHRTLHHQQAHASSLQTQLQALKTSLLKSTAAEQVALAALAKSECAQLCNLVMTHLPRELRDMVYQHLVPSTTRISREYFRSIRDPISGLHTYDAANWKAAHYPEHYWDASYVGAPFLHELTQIYFLTSTFAFGDDDGLIEQFLTTDLMDVGYAPAELVSRVEVYLNAMTYDRTTCVGYMFGCATKPERLVAALRGVEGLKEGASLCVHFETRAADGEVRDKQIGTVCDAVRPCLREVEKKGCKVRLVVDKKTQIGLGDGAGEREERGVDVSSCEAEVKVKSV